MVETITDRTRSGGFFDADANRQRLLLEQGRTGFFKIDHRAGGSLAEAPRLIFNVAGHIECFLEEQSLQSDGLDRFSFMITTRAAYRGLG